MKKLKIAAGIFWAFACLILIIILFPGLSSLSRTVAELPFMKINPRYAGGDVAFQSINQGCTLVVRNPVFSGLLKERKSGFVQIDWRGNIPENITDTIDFDMNDNPDFVIGINTKASESRLDPITRSVKGILVSTPTSYGWSVRINLVREED